MEIVIVELDAGDWGMWTWVQANADTVTAYLAVATTEQNMTV